MMFYISISQSLSVDAFVQSLCSGQQALMARLDDRAASAAFMHEGDPSPSTSSPLAVGNIPGQGDQPEIFHGRGTKITLA